MTGEPEEPMTEGSRIQKTYEIYRSYIQHEDDLIHQRTTWFITIQSFLLATFGFSYQKKYEIAAEIIRYDLQDKMSKAVFDYNMLLLFLCIVGLVTSIVSLRSVGAAVLAIKALQQKWDGLVAQWQNDAKLKPLLQELPEIIGGGGDKSIQRGTLLPKLLPVWFVMFWFVVVTLLVVKTLGLVYDIRFGTPY